MKTGKLPEQVLVRSVLKQVGHRRKDVLSGPAVGLDCAALQAEADEVFVLSSDPITGTVRDLGEHAIHITANDLCAAGAEPVGVMLTLLLPQETEEPEIRSLMQAAENTCAALGMEILGGHTEITPVVKQPLLSVTGIGKMKKEEFLHPEQIAPGQDVLVSKWIALEGTAILAKEKEQELLRRFSPDFVHTAQSFSRYLSVLEDSRAARRAGVIAMHDITEGGVFGALWEMAELGHVGLDIDLRKIPIRQESIEICEYFTLNPYQLMSSGSMMMIAKDGKAVADALHEAGIPASVIGRTTDGKDRILRNQGEIRYLDRPQPDELYKAV